MAHFISESFDRKEFVAKSETHPYPDAHREAEPSRGKPTHAPRSVSLPRSFLGARRQGARAASELVGRQLRP